MTSDFEEEIKTSRLSTRRLILVRYWSKQSGFGGGRTQRNVSRLTAHSLPLA